MKDSNPDYIWGWSFGRLREGELSELLIFWVLFTKMRDMDWVRLGDVITTSLRTDAI